MYKKLQFAFTWIDYTLFSGVIGVSIAIGIYFGCFGNKLKSKTDYLLGGKTMKILPVAASLVASDISGIALLAVPADVYKYGATYAWSCIAILLGALIIGYIYLPVFHKLQLTSTYEYLNLRFDGNVRTMASVLFALSMLLYNPIIIYLPALALAQGTGISVHLISTITCIVCIFYTTIGGLKAVVWTDTIQMTMMVASMVLILCLGVFSAGGLTNIISTSSKGHRFDIYDFNIDPTIRDGICALIVGTLAKTLSFRGISQSTMQRFLALPTVSDARKAIGIFVIGVSLVKLASVITGLIMFTKYADCDPLSSGIVKHSDQMLPYYVMDVTGHIPGLSGLFIAGVFSASLSTLSASLNTLSATIYEDLVLPFASSFSDRQVNIILRAITVVAGISCTVLVLLIEKMGSILPLANSVTAISGGPLLGLFTLGIIFPSANSKGAMSGAVAGLALLTWAMAGNQWYKRQPYYVDPVKPFSTTGCEYQVNISKFPEATISELPFYLYRITFWYYTLMGLAVTIFIGLLVSWVTTNDASSVNPDLLTPVRFRVFMRKREVKESEVVPLNEEILNSKKMNNKNENNV